MRQLRSLTLVFFCACSSFEVRLGKDGGVPSDGEALLADRGVEPDGQIVHDSPLFPGFIVPDAPVVAPDASPPDASVPDVTPPDAPVPEPTVGAWTAMATDGAPSGRCGLTAVWTGQEMLIWGGQGNAGVLGDGARYNPATNTWTSIASEGAPEARTNYSAVWTGEEMIVWGGMGASQTLRTGGRYNPSTNTWTTVDDSTDDPYGGMAPAPTARQNHRAVWTGSHMLIWGGENGTGQLFNVGGQYNPAWDQWYEMDEPSLNAPLVTRKYHSAVWSGYYMIIWGGWNGSWFGNGRRFAPSTQGGSWSDMPNSSARGQHSAVWTGTEMLVWGGQDSYGFLNTGERYSVAYGTWSALTVEDAPSERVGHSAVWTLNKMAVWGGRDEQGTSLGNGALYSPLTDSWETMSGDSAPQARWGHSAVWTGYEMLVWGGCPDFYCAQPINTGGRYVP